MFPLKLFLIVVLLFHNANSRIYSRPPLPFLPGRIQPRPIVVSPVSSKFASNEQETVAVSDPSYSILPVSIPKETITSSETGDTATENLIIVYPINQAIPSGYSQSQSQSSVLQQLPTSRPTNTMSTRTTMKRYSTPLPTRYTTKVENFSPLSTTTPRGFTTFAPKITSTTLQPTTVDPYGPSTLTQPLTTKSYPPTIRPQPSTTTTPYSPTTTPQPSTTTTPYLPTTTPQPSTTTTHYTPTTKPQPPTTTTPNPPTTTSQSSKTTIFYPSTVAPQPSTTIVPYKPTTTTQTSITITPYLPKTSSHLPIPTAKTPRPTTTTYQPNESLKNFTCLRSNQYYAAANECDSYIECTEYVAVKRYCHDGLHFKKDTIWPDYPCSYPSEVKCNVGTVSQPARPTVECPRLYGFYSVHDDDCSKYIMCQNGVPIIMNCPYGLVFNNASSNCDWPVNVQNCNPEAFKNFKCPPLSSAYDDKNTIFKYKYLNSCDKYIACQHGFPRLLSCDEGLSFDENIQACVDSTYVTDCMFTNKIY